MVVVKPEVYTLSEIKGGDSFQITMEVTDKMYGKLPLCNAIEMIPGGVDSVN